MITNCAGATRGDDGSREAIVVQHLFIIVFTLAIGDDRHNRIEIAVPLMRGVLSGLIGAKRASPPVYRSQNRNTDACASQNGVELIFLPANY